MLTRLKVDGFKNLVGVDVRFGPFSCIAGANGVGKSNLFDAIRFLSALADSPLIDACRSVRDEDSRTGNIESVFHRSDQYMAQRMSFEAEMIVPRFGEDDLGQSATASITFLRYKLVLAYKHEIAESAFGGIEIVHEELSHITQSEAFRQLGFRHSKLWRQSAVTGRRSTPLYISTENGEPTRIKIHQDGGSSGRPIQRLAARLPRTVLSASNATESPTALQARREMQSWRLLQLEPSALRRPDVFNGPKHLDSDGAHLPATLYRLAKEAGATEGHSNAAYTRVANRLADLINDVRFLYIDRDERKELLSLLVAGKDNTPHIARSLSDGTLRFLALATLVNDPDEEGVLCMEEPENGIHPARIPAIINLLKDIACDVSEPVGPDNPLRQVIINTHSPAVVAEIPEDALLIAEPNRVLKEGGILNSVRFSALSGTWRTSRTLDGDPSVIAKGKMLDYLNPFNIEDRITGGPKRASDGVRRVIDREDLQPLLPFVK